MTSSSGKYDQPPTRSEETAAQPFELSSDITLFDWQQKAVESWTAGDEQGPHRGTLEIFTGGGKTVIALAAFARISADDPAAKLAIVVPTEALARQWIHTVERLGSIPSAEIGLMGAGGRASLKTKRVLVAVLNSAAKKLPDESRQVDSLMLVVDECHRAGAKTFSKVLSAQARYRLGLSATPTRDDTDEDGLPLSFEQQAVGQLLGGIVYRFGLREARALGWLPQYTVHHHGVELTPEERREYEHVSSKVSDAADQLASLGLQPSSAWFQSGKQGARGDAARSYIGALTARKDLLYRATERSRVARRIIERLVARDQPAPRILLFHERVAEVERLFEQLRNTLPSVAIALEHSELPTARREAALQSFRDGQTSVLVSVKSLVEGIDVPDADVGISVASSSSVRQRVQTLGRVLRRRFDDGVKIAEMHVIYASDTVDESIYGKEDWSDLTGADANRYWRWTLDPLAESIAQDQPPQKPRPTEEAEWLRFGEQAPAQPVVWHGELPSQEFSVDTRGNVTTMQGGWIDNASDVPAMIERVRGQKGGRFRVTPTYLLVLVFGKAGEAMAPYVAGRLSEPLRLKPALDSNAETVNTADLTAGESYPGPVNEERGAYRIRQSRGGVIERRVGSTSEFALTDDATEPRQANASRLLSAWKQLGLTGMKFQINSDWHAWFRDAGDAKFLCAVPGGFLFPHDVMSPSTTTPDGSPIDQEGEDNASH